MVQFLINKSDETVTLACVASVSNRSVSNRVIVRKLEREPKKKNGRGKETFATQATVTCNRDLWNVPSKVKKPLHRY